MDKKIVLEELESFLEPDQILIDEPLKEHTYFKIGGPADFVVIPESPGQIKKIIQLCHRESISYYVIGNGTDLLVADEGFEGIIIKMAKPFCGARIKENRICVGAGMLLPHLSQLAFKHRLTGIEFACGIPGSVGGAVIMNAGAYGGEMKDIISRAKVITSKGEEKIYNKEDLRTQYRQSMVDTEDIVYEVEIELKSANEEEIKRVMDDLTAKREEKQPLKMPSAGSVFKKPDGHYAGALIEEAGLKGFRVGDAQVSPKHAGFIVNVGNATASDVLALIDQIKQKIKEKFNVELEQEVKYIGGK